MTTPHHQTELFIDTIIDFTPSLFNIKIIIIWLFVNYEFWYLIFRRNIVELKFGTNKMVIQAAIFVTLYAWQVERIRPTRGPPSLCLCPLLSRQSAFI